MKVPVPCPALPHLNFPPGRDAMLDLYLVKDSKGVAVSLRAAIIHISPMSYAKRGNPHYYIPLGVLAVSLTSGFATDIGWSSGYGHRSYGRILRFLRTRPATRPGSQLLYPHLRLGRPPVAHEDSRPVPKAREGEPPCLYP